MQLWDWEGRPAPRVQNNVLKFQRSRLVKAPFQGLAAESDRNTSILGYARCAVLKLDHIKLVL